VGAACEGQPICPPICLSAPLLARMLVQALSADSSPSLPVALHAGVNGSVSQPSHSFLLPRRRPFPTAVAAAGSCPGVGPPWATVAEVRRAVLPEQNPEGPTVGSIFNECSYGKSRLGEQNSLVMGLVRLPCSGTRQVRGLDAGGDAARCCSPGL